MGLTLTVRKIDVVGLKIVNRLNLDLAERNWKRFENGCSGPKYGPPILSLIGQLWA